MRANAMLLLGSLLVPFAPDDAADAATSKKLAFVAYVPQTPRVSMTCFPPKLRTILADLGKQFGRQVIVTSGHRTTRGTRKRSQHRTCNAADIRIPGVAPSVVAKAARANRLRGGVGTYCSGIVHVDVGPQRDWNYCTRRKRR